MTELKTTPNCSAAVKQCHPRQLSPRRRMEMNAGILVEFSSVLKTDDKN
jgi:hypothetical protein